MTREESRALQVGARVCWDGDLTDVGLVTATDWSGVHIEWDKGLQTYIHHNDMEEVTVVAKH